MKFDPETIYDLAADTARAMVGELFHDRDEETIESIYKNLLKDPKVFMPIPALTSICKLLKMAGEQMGNEQAGKAAPALRRLAKNSPREEQRGVFLDEQGRQIACDGARAVRLNRPIKGIPEVLPFLNFENLISSRKGNRIDINAPDDKTLCKEIHDQRIVSRKDCPLWNFGEGLPAVNAAYLRDMLDILPDAKLCIYGSANSGVWFESPAGDGILLPVRVRRA